MGGGWGREFFPPYLNALAQRKFTAMSSIRLDLYPRCRSMAYRSNSIFAGINSAQIPQERLSMKQCTYCGKEYSDDASLCVVDRYPLRNATPQSPRHVNHQPPARRSEQWLIFAGIPAAVVAVVFVLTEANHSLEHALGEKALPYVLFFTPVIIVIGSKMLCDFFPKRLILPSGILGWIIAAASLCWFFWSGPGALKF